MRKPTHHGGQPQYIHLRAPYEFEKLRGRRRGIIAAFLAGSIKGVLFAVIPILLLVGYLNYSANGWTNFVGELLAHIELILIPLAIAAAMGGLVSVLRR
jgi:hypothetical protein